MTDAALGETDRYAGEQAQYNGILAELAACCAGLSAAGLHPLAVVKGGIRWFWRTGPESRTRRTLLRASGA